MKFDTVLSQDSKSSPRLKGISAPGVSDLDGPGWTILENVFPP